MTNWTETEYAKYQQRRKAAEAKKNASGSVQPEFAAPSLPSARELRLRLPLPPGINCMYVNVPGKGRALTKDARDWKYNAALLINVAARHQGWYYSQGDRLFLMIVWHFASEASDIDGPIKIVMDSMGTTCGFNDKVIDDLAISRGAVEPNGPNCEIRLQIKGGNE